MIRAVTFDFWGTLYEEGPLTERRHQLRGEYARGFLLGKGYQVAEKQLGYAFRVLERYVNWQRESRHAGLDAEEVGQRLAEIVGIRLEGGDAAQLGELISSASREAPPVLLDTAREVLSALHGRAALALICDTGFTLGHDLYAVMEADGVGQLFDAFTFSNQTGTTKPEVRQFHYTLYRLGCRPDEAVHVGDLEATDVAGARQAGMRAIRIVNADADPATEADAAVEDLRGVPDVLRGWGLAV